MMQTNAANAAAKQQYEQQLKIRSARWDATRAVWNNKLADFKGEISSNQEAAGRAWASEQYKLNEQFQQAAFQKQDMLAQLVQAQGALGASEQYGRSAKRLQMEQVAAYGRNNAIIAANLASARGAMMQRNEDIRRQMISENNRAWNQVAAGPIGELEPVRPQMQGHGSTLLQMGIGIAGAALGSIGKNAAPKGWDNVPSYNKGVVPNAFNGNAALPNYTWNSNWTGGYNGLKISGFNAFGN